MTAVDFFFISAGLAICISVATWIFIFYKIVHLISTAELEIKSVKDSLKLSGLTLISKILNLKGGGK